MITYDDFVKDYSQRIDSAYHEAHGHGPATSDQFHNAWRLLREGWGIDAVISDIKGQPYTEGPGSHPEEMLPIDAPVAAIVPLHVDGRIFRTPDGAAWRWKGVSAFKLLNRFANGEDIKPFLDAYKGYNVLRIFSYTPAKDWGSQSWDMPTAEQVKSFVDYVGKKGFYVELTLLTSDESERIAEAGQLVLSITPCKLPNLLLEIGNEPLTHKNIQVDQLKSACESSSYLYASGVYEDSKKWFGQYGTAHTGRDSEWPRRSHDLLEYFNGGGPNSPDEPACKVPWIADEPAKPQDVAYDLKDVLAYFSSCSILGGGATVHTETGKFANLPTDSEKQWIAMVLQGLNCFPEEAPNGGYRRIVENSLRTYVVGNYMVRIRPTTSDAPEPGWTKLDPDAITWRR